MWLVPAHCVPPWMTKFCISISGLLFHRRKAIWHVLLEAIGITGDVRSLVHIRITGIEYRSLTLGSVFLHLQHCSPHNLLLLWPQESWEDPIIWCHLPKRTLCLYLNVQWLKILLRLNKEGHFLLKQHLQSMVYHLIAFWMLAPNRNLINYWCLLISVKLKGKIFIWSTTQYKERDHQIHLGDFKILYYSLSFPSYSLG